MLPGIRSLAVAMHLEIYWVYAETALLLAKVLRTTPGFWLINWNTRGP
ncbi:hypothetical protein [Photorhabdus australis]